MRRAESTSTAFFFREHDIKDTEQLHLLLFNYSLIGYSQQKLGILDPPKNKDIQARSL